MSEPAKVPTNSRPEGHGPTPMSFCGPPPLQPGEDPAAYHALLAQVSEQLKPGDLFEEIWNREFTDLIWEGQRYRGLLIHHLEMQLPKVLEQLLQPVLQHEAETTPAPGRSFTARIDAAYQRLNGEPELLRRWSQGEAAAIERVNTLLATLGWTIDHVRARVAINELDKIERINRMIANIEWRRAMLLREIERHRTSFARHARQRVEQIEQSVMDEHADCAVEPALPTPPDKSGTETAAAIEAAVTGTTDTTVKVALDAQPAVLAKVTLAAPGPTVSLALDDVVGARGATGPASSSMH